MASRKNIAALVEAAGVLARAEDANESEARRHLEKTAHEQRLWKERWLFIVACWSYVLLGMLCIVIVVGSAAWFDGTTKEFARGALGALFTGLVGFVVGQQLSGK